MSVVGIDLGAQSTKIGVARNKGIDIVRIMPRDSNLSLSIWNDAHVFAAGPWSELKANQLFSSWIIQITNEVSNRQTP